MHAKRFRPRHPWVQFVHSYVFGQFSAEVKLIAPQYSAPGRKDAKFTAQPFNGAGHLFSTLKDHSSRNTPVLSRRIDNENDCTGTAAECRFLPFDPARSIGT